MADNAKQKGGSAPAGAKGGAKGGKPQGKGASAKEAKRLVVVLLRRASHVPRTTSRA